MRVKSNILCKFVIGLLLLVVSHGHAQNVAINGSGTAPNGDAILDLSNNTDGGFLLPVMTTNAGITTPTNSLLYYNSTLNCLEDYYSGCSCWQPAFCPCTVAPSTPAAPSGPTPICKNSAYTYSVTAVSNASTYTWQLLGGGGGYFVSNNSTTVTGPSTAQTAEWTANGTYTVEVLASNACGSSVYSAAFVVTVSSSTPPTPSTPGGSSPICTGSAGNTYTVTAVTGASTYNWTFTASAGSFTSGSWTTATN